MSEREGKICSIVLIGNYHYNGKIISEDNFFVTIIDRFGKEVSLAKSRIEKLEVQE